MMTQELQIFREHLKKSGLKNTRQREEILAHLLKAEEHLSPEDMFGVLRRKDPRLGRATVFRTLKILEDCGLAARVTFADGRHRFEKKHGRRRHDHIVCVSCGRVIEFESPAIERLEERAARENGFTLLWRRHEMFGRCRACEGKRRGA